MDYQGNAKKAQGPEITPTASKKIEKVVTGELVTKKKPLGRKIKDLFIDGDAKSTLSYVAMSVLLPAARNMIMDASTKGIERMLYGDRAIQRRNFGSSPSRYSYNMPVQRARDPLTNPPLGMRTTQTARQNRDDIILTSKEEAELVLQSMFDIVNQYEAVSVADLNELVGLPLSPIDNKWGWTYLAGAAVRQVREGYLLDLPAAEPI